MIFNLPSQKYVQDKAKSLILAGSYVLCASMPFVIMCEPWSNELGGTIAALGIAGMRVGAAVIVGAAGMLGSVTIHTMLSNKEEVAAHRE